MPCIWFPSLSLPGLTRQSIRMNAFAKKMDARVKPAHDSCFELTRR